MTEASTQPTIVTSDKAACKAFFSKSVVFLLWNGGGFMKRNL